MIVDGTAYLRTPVAPLTKGTGSGSWPTPTVYRGPTEGSVRKMRLLIDDGEITREEATVMIGGDPFKRQGIIPERWPTPTAHNSIERGYPAEGRRNSPTLTWVALKSWPTPLAHMAKENGSPSEGRLNTPTLTRLAHNSFPTPCASDHRDRGHLGNPSVQRRQRIGKQVSLGQSVSPTSGQLNPDWVELLMGWPKGWTSLEPVSSEVMEDWLAMDNYWPHDWEGDTPRTGKKANNSSRLKAIGNGQVSVCVVKAWKLLR